MSQIRRYNAFIDSILPNPNGYDYCDKEKCVSQHVLYMLNRTQRIFKWSGLPKSIPQRILELYLQINGNVCFYKHDNDLYVFTGGLGGVPDEYYRPTIYTIANPYLNINKNLEINKDCVLMLNDSLMVGLLPLFNRYSTALTETELSLRVASINSRIVSLITCPDDRTYESAKSFIDDVLNGKLGVMMEQPLVEGIKSQPYGTSGNSNIIKALIELEQYQKASWFNEIGLNANFNMKHEQLNSSETQLNEDALLPLVDDMLECRLQACQLVNDMYGTDITVSLDSSWEDNQEELNAKLYLLKQEGVTNDETIRNDEETTETE